MARNFCGYIDLSASTDLTLTLSMAKALNLNNLYSIELSGSEKASLASLYSKNFPKPTESEFMRSMKSTYAIASFALITNINDLMGKLGISTNDSSISVEELILRLYLKFGKDCTKLIYGDWAVAIWDYNEQSLFLSRNHHSGSSLFYHRKGDKLYFSTLLTGLLQIEKLVGRLDEEKLFSEFCRFCEFEDRTLYKDVKFLQPGHNLTFSTKGLSIDRYWILEKTPESPFKSEQDCFDRFHDLYQKSVESRLNISMNWGTTLSGGLDSGSTTALHSQHAKAKKESIEAFSYVPFYDNFSRFNSQKRLGNEKGLILEAADYFGNINLNLITKSPKNVIPFLTRDFEKFGHPPNTINNWWIEEICEQAEKKGVNAILIAEGGNASVSFKGVPSHASAQQFFQDTQNGLSLSTSEYVSGLTKSVATSLYTNLKRSPSARKKRIDQYFETQTLVNREFYEAINGRGIIEHELFDKNREYTAGKRFQLTNIRPGVHCRLGLWNQLGTKYDMVFMDTTRDVPLLEYLVSLPNHMFQKKGMDRYLLRQTFKGNMPDNVLFNKKRAMQMSDIALLYEQDLKNFNSEVNDVLASDLCGQYVHKNKLRTISQALNTAHDQDESFTHTLFLNSTSIFLAFFLKWFDQNSR